MRDLYTAIIEDGYEDTTVGESIIETFYNGNFTSGVKELIEINVSPREFGDYLLQLSNDLGYEDISDIANNFFDYDFFISLGESYNTIAREME